MYLCFFTLQDGNKFEGEFTDTLYTSKPVRNTCNMYTHMYMYMFIIVVQVFSVDVRVKGSRMVFRPAFREIEGMANRLSTIIVESSHNLPRVCYMYMYMYAIYMYMYTIIHTHYYNYTCTRTCTCPLYMYMSYKHYTCIQVEHILFNDLLGHSMTIPSVSAYDQIVLYARKESYRLVAGNFHGPDRYA